MIRALLSALLLSLLLACGCASTPSSGAVTQPLDESRTITAGTAIPPSVERLPAQEEAAAPDDRSGVGPLLRVPDIVGDGEAFAVEFEAPGAQRVDLLWRGRTLTLSAPDPRTGIFKALLPVPLDEKAESLPLVVAAHWADGKREHFTADLAVNRRSYPVQRLTVEPKFVTPPKEMEEKIKRDRAEMRAAVRTVSAHRYWNLPMLRPIPGDVTSQYGLRRVFNEQARNPHRGLDLRGGEGDPIHAADDGIIVLVSDHYYGGKTVVIDHGLGVLTAYLHLSGFNAHTGQQVKRGDVIGFVGSTGRVTGPHLHLSLYALGESINPLPLLSNK
jgi:murein DD-endopeptidase MepM/ murein hydrolase activator NlpD